MGGRVPTLLRCLEPASERDIAPANTPAVDVISLPASLALALTRAMLPPI